MQTQVRKVGGYERTTPQWLKDQENDPVRFSITINRESRRAYYFFRNLRTMKYILFKLRPCTQDEYVNTSTLIMGRKPQGEVKPAKEWLKVARERFPWLKESTSGAKD